MKSMEELTTHCIRCGFCLEDCPTFIQTGNELESPRGRIYLVRSAMEGKLDWNEDVKEHLDLCLGCRACETACPSGVEYGAILEMARDKIESASPNLIRKGLLMSTTNPAILKAQLVGSRLLGIQKMPGFMSRFVSQDAQTANLPRPQAYKPLPTIENAPTKGEVLMLQGCAMQVLFPRVHECTVRLLSRLGYKVKSVSQGCCGALHAHNGQLETARGLARNLIKAFEGDMPIIVNSAGCGSTMKEYQHLLDDNNAEAFSKRVFDISEFFLSEGLADLLAKTNGLQGRKLTYHDACHLSHGQKIMSQPRQLVQAIAGTEFVELPEAMMCCGSAGIYNVLQPKMAKQLLDRKVSNVVETKTDVVATGNPGCHAWIRQGCEEAGAAPVLHTAELLEAAFIGLEHFV
jgi:glycolate oxidase iron-sulfur subunit